MRKETAKQVITHLLQVSGVQVNGSDAWDIQVHNEDFYQRVLRDGELGFGESYVEGWWDCPRIDILVDRLFAADAESYIRSYRPFYFKFLFAKFINLQTKSRALKVGKVHYDLGNILFESMLGDTLTYTCGYWPQAKNLEEAQVAKLDLACRKLLLEPGMTVLDIGCGWGSFARHAAEKYGVKVVGVTISKQQHTFAQNYCQNLPVEIRFQDYRDVNEKYDRIVSIGMFEHVGHFNYRTFMQVVHHNLAHDGIFLLHTIGGNESTATANEWITKYIFPNGMLPSIAQVGKATEKLFVMEDWHNFGLDYDKTLMAWHKNFNARWNEIKVHFDERFFRMWNYYLLSCAGGFRSRAMQLWQIVLSRSGIKGSYQSVR